jgi:ABC-type nitrate/sulfonate/bicarbonate transport system ATPase subunit
MDEPFGALDAQTRELMQEELLAIMRRAPKTVVLSPMTFARQSGSRTG